MDRHVEKQDVFHLLAEAAEMRPKEEIAMDGRQIADDAVFQRAAQPPDSRHKPPILHHGMNFTGLFRQFDQRGGFLHRGGKRLFAEHMAPGLKTGLNHGEACLWDDDIKKDVGFRFSENLAQIRADDRVGKGEFLGKRACRVLVQVDHPGDPDRAGDFRRGLNGAQPAFGHGSAPA